jgi:hypothetical protein
MDSSIRNIAKDPLARPFFNMIASIVGIAGAAVYYLHSSITSGDGKTRDQLDSRIDKLETEMKSNSGKLEARMEINSGKLETEMKSNNDKLEARMEINSDKLMRELALIRSDLVNDRHTAGQERQAATLERVAFSLDRQALKDDLTASGNKRPSGKGSVP